MSIRRPARWRFRCCQFWNRGGIGMIQRLVTFCSSQKQYEFLLQIVTKNNNISTEKWNLKRKYLRSNTRGKGRDSKLIVGFTDYLWRIVPVFFTRAKKKSYFNRYSAENYYCCSLLWCRKFVASFNNWSDIICNFRGNME